MKNLIKIFSVILFVILSVKCFPEKLIDENDKKMYKEILTLYPANLTSHFPNIDDGRGVFIELEFPRGRYLNFIHLAMEYSDEQIDTITTNAKINAIRQYHFSDSCSMIIEYDSTLYSSLPFKLHMCKDSVQFLPIPNFAFCKDISMSPDFYKNAIIYMLGADNGMYLSEDHLSRKGVGLDQKWVHGYTKGIAISGKIVIYWLEVW